MRSERKKNKKRIIQKENFIYNGTSSFIKEKNSSRSDSSFEKPFYKKTTRSAIKALRSLTDKTEAESFLPKVVGMIDKLAKKNNIHKNKASNLKSGLTKHVKALA